MFQIEIWSGASWVPCGTANNERLARELLKDTVRCTDGNFRLKNPAGKVIEKMSSHHTRSVQPFYHGDLRSQEV